MLIPTPSVIFKGLGSDKVMRAEFTNGFDILIKVTQSQVFVKAVNLPRASIECLGLKSSSTIYSFLPPVTAFWEEQTMAPGIDLVQPLLLQAFEEQFRDGRSPWDPLFPLPFKS